MNIKIGQKYFINDRVTKTLLSGPKNPVRKRHGTVLGVTTMKNKLGHVYYYYDVKWDDLKSSSKHSQNVLRPITDST